MLTNEGGLPTITVAPISVWQDSSNDVRILTPIVTSQGLIKRGAGTMTLTATNQLGSNVVLEEGLVLPYSRGALNTISSPQTVIYQGGGIRVISGGPTLNFRNRIVGCGWIVSTNGNYDGLTGAFEGNGTLLVHASARLTLGGGSATAFASFNGEIDCANSPSGCNVRIDLGSTSVYDLGHLVLNTGTNGGRFSFRTTVTPTRVKIGALKGGPSTRFQSSEKSDCTSLYWEIGYLNYSTMFEGSVQNYNNLADRVGHLVKVGTGKLILTGNNTYTGMTIISNGVLALAGNAALSGATNYIMVLSGAIFDVADLAIPFTLLPQQSLGGNGCVVGNVALQAGTLLPGLGVGTLTFSNNLSMSGMLTVTNVFEISEPEVHDSIYVAGDLELSGLIEVKLVPVASVIPNGRYPLYRWGGTLIGDVANLVLVHPPQQGTLKLRADTVNKVVFLDVTGVPGGRELIWRGDGVQNSWDFVAPNWRDGSGLCAFASGDIAIFEDSGSNNVPVVIQIDVTPKSVIVNAQKDYSFTSSGGFGIVGAGSLIKSNTGTLYVFNNNAYAGPTVIGEGRIVVGDGFSSSGSLGVGPITNHGVLVYNRPDSFTNTSAIAGSGVLVQAGSGSLALGGANTYSGGTIVSNGGTLILLNPQAAGTGQITLSSGVLAAGSLNIDNRIRVIANSEIATTGTLQLNTDRVQGEGILTLSGTIRFNSPDLIVDCPLVINNVLQSYNVTGTQIFNGVISGPGVYQRRWTASNPSYTGATVFNAQNTYSGGTLLREGALGFGVSSIVLDGILISGPIGTGPLNQDNATYTAVFAYGGPRTVANEIRLNPAGQAFVITGNYPLTLSGQIDLGGGIKEIHVDWPATGILAGTILNGVLVKTGFGTLYIDGYNGASSNTVVSGELGGIGTFAGPVTVLPNGVLAPGRGLGSIRIESDLTLYGTLRMELDRMNPAQKNDTIHVLGTFDSGNGVLEVTNVGPALVAGDIFQLFDRARVFGKVILPTNDYVNKVRYTWIDRLSIDGRIIVQSVQPLLSTTPTNITFTVKQDVLELAWPTTHLGWTLQSNSVNVGDPTQWFDCPPDTGSRDTNIVSIPILYNKTNVFFRLILK